MGQIRTIKKRMVAVRTIQRITKTMQMIATARFTAALQRAKATRPYTDRIRDMSGRLAASAGEFTHPLMRPEPAGAKREVFLVISSDRGLCGAYNGNVLKQAISAIRRSTGAGNTLRVETAGRKASLFFKFARVEVAARHQIGDKPTYLAVNELAKTYMREFTEGTCDAVRVVYMRFVSNSRQVPEVMTLLPLEPPAATESKSAASGGGATVYEFSPDAPTLLDAILPKTVSVSLFQAFNDAVVSEQVMRMVAMKAATDNAAGLGRTLKRDYNRARQTRITTELTEIVGGAAALE
ncbi:MAG: ATP synthase F1 subunit gamma [Phycisphaerae bacterium]|nr:ATP synthase F1 subunit gamma [Phycisphaerae bacterium]